MSVPESRSWWHLTPGRKRLPAVSLQSDIEADVVIVGAGFTGLWTAYYLSEHDPSVKICLLESEFAGFGASGRNGGWCVGEMAASAEAYEKKQPGGALRMARAIQQTVDEVGRVCVRHGIDCHYHKGGVIYPATNAAQLKRLEARAREAGRIGLDPEDFRLLSAAGAAEHIRLPGIRGGLFSPHCAAIHPYRLVLGLVEVLRERGVDLYEQSPVVAIDGRVVRTDSGRVRANCVVRATEAYTGSIAGHERQLIPIYSHMIVTEPLPASAWEEIGLRERQTFEDARHVIYYGQRTADDRIAIGGLASPYRFGSGIDPRTEVSHPAHGKLERLLSGLFPMLGEIGIEHRWGGVFGTPRDLYPSVGFDRRSGFAWAGGYIGEGVAASNLAGRTLADLLLERHSDRLDLPWVGHQSRRWEPEPLRWLGVAGAAGALSLFDWIDGRNKDAGGR